MIVFGRISGMMVALTCVMSSAGAVGSNNVTDLGAAQPGEIVEFDVTLPSRDQAGLDRLLAAQQDPRSPEYRHWLTPEAYQARFGPDAAALAQVHQVLEQSGFAVVDRAQGVRASGGADRAGQLFGTALHHLRTADGKARVAAPAGLRMPAALAALGAHVSAFDPMVRMHSMVRQSALGSPQARRGPYGSYWFDDLKQALKAPDYRLGTGTGRTIAILIDADIKNSDMASYFTHEKLVAPNIPRMSVDGGAGFDANGDSVEATLDVQQAHGMAPGATLLLYLIPDLNDGSIQDGLNRILDDNKADVVSLSFGTCEIQYTAAYNNGSDQTSVLDTYHSIFARGNTQGVTFVTSSGDNGALECPEAAYFNGGTQKRFTYVASADSPATDPDMTGVGGTNLVTNYAPPSLDSTYIGENAKGDPLDPDDPDNMGSKVYDGYWGSGGGPSIHFAAPSWQANVTTGTTMRATPDLSLHMGGCPSGATSCDGYRSSDLAIVNGVKQSLIGTSAAAPAFAGVVALMDQYQGGKRLGNINPTIYAMAKTQASGGLKVYRQHIYGYNGVYVSAYDGSIPYNMVIGNGSVNIKRFIGELGLANAGVPQSASNP